MLGPGEGRLAVDDPGLPAQLGEPRGKRGGLGQGGQAPGDVQLAPVEGPLQAGERPAAEDLGQRADGKEEAGRRRNPARPVGRERAAGHDAVDVHMLGEGLAPGVEHGGHAHVATEVTRIATEAREGGGRGAERAGDRSAAGDSAPAG